ncbi:MAG: hypothetical protein COY69_02820 [Candidatus Magasanikbacteria bacterium CG_4_10_14_0_8_um_filter_32_14]|uniref:Type II toxin-antitoxin system HicA family toxin n=1 Tax=Candidatus Magasanikbacteria bacterium CG_4_10_14_0_8_um_filter_32_14 TaxID=1974640 RepID=A0A2M7R8Y9_9BACT|nr:MAG: hypothetical protein COY69_02820 [Candidatus Magasanikbacteria bacterium CG_4_10_14_0_8_um_filter_32_14]
MVKLANFSGKKVIKILTQYFGFVFVFQKGSHIKLRKIVKKETITVIVPNHPELASGTLNNILHQAQVEVKDFLKI